MNSPRQHRSTLSARLRLSLPPLIASLLSGCSGGTSDPAPPAGRFAATAAAALSASSPTRDEDPSILRTRDGTMCVAWFSDRDGGNQEIYLAQCNDSTAWSGPARITNHPGGDFYPNLLQDDSGAIHLTWFRWSAPFVGQVMHKSTRGDCAQLAQSTETPVTTDAAVDDWVPAITQAANGDLLVYFVSNKRNVATNNNDVYVATKAPADTAWSAPVPLAGINSAAEHDHLPFVARTGATLSLVWVRNDGASLMPWAAPLPKSDLWFATSSDGLAWSAPQKITNEPAPAVHLYPSIYQRFDGSWWLVWLSTRLAPQTQTPALFELPLGSAGPLNAYPIGIEQNTLLSAGLPGYSHRVSTTPTTGVYLGAWVDGVEPTQDVFFRYFDR